MRSHGHPRALANRFSVPTAALLLSLLVAGVATAQQEELEYNFLGAGARANGMGDAFVAVADDATAIFWNPAGLFLLDQPEASIGFQFVSETLEQAQQRQPLLLANEPAGSAGLNFASFVLPTRLWDKKFVFAFAAQKAFDFTAESQEIDSLDPLTFEQRRNSGGPFSYSGGVAFSPLRGLMLGVSLSLYRGSANLADNQIVYVDSGVVASASASGHLPVNGTSFGMGALYDFQSRGGPPLRLGLKFVPAFDFSGNIDADFAFRVVDSQEIVVEQTRGLEYGYLLDFPLDLGVGLAWNPRRDLLLAADFEHRRFRDSATRVFGAPNVSFDEDGNLVVQREDEVNPLSVSGADLNQWRVGFEWSWVNGLTVIPVRVGIKNLPQVSANERRFVDPEDGEVTTVFDEQVVGTAVTSGVGFVTDSFVFDVSMEYGGWSQNVIQFDSDGRDSQELKTRRFSLKMSLIVYF